MATRGTTLVIGAGGAVGTRLVNALARKGERLVLADRMRRFPESLSEKAIATFPGVDIRDGAGIKSLFKDAPAIDTVWNLAAPLSVETALNPTVAHEITVGGMRNVLDAMSDSGVRKICFTDSIGSFGSTSPRKSCTARWLTENPTQDPGSDYGMQKRGCRELMKQFAADGGDPRFAVLPGVLHSEAAWGKGTTEYALEALRAAAGGDEFDSPIEPHVVLPMIYVSDLMAGLLALQYAPEDRLREPERGYCIPGLSFSPSQLFHEIRKHMPDFKTTLRMNPNMNKFAKLWPDTLSKKEAFEDLGYSPRIGLREMVAHVMISHEERLARTRVMFELVDQDRDGFMGKDEFKDFLREVLHVPADTPRPIVTQLCDELCEQTLKDLNLSTEGRISFNDFHDWTKQRSVFDYVGDFLSERHHGPQLAM